MAIIFFKCSGRNKPAKSETSKVVVPSITYLVTGDTEMSIIFENILMFLRREMFC